LRQAQIQLAIAAAPHNAFLAARFFYGCHAGDGNEWKTLTERLDERLVKRNSMYKSWVMKTAGAWERTAATISASMRRDLRVKGVSTNPCGTVTVVWCGTELPGTDYLTVYGRFLSNDDPCWIPLRTVCAESFPTGYPKWNSVLMW
jgi:hypothetical protein